MNFNFVYKKTKEPPNKHPQNLLNSSRISNFSGSKDESNGKLGTFYFEKM